jgi:hypothetical protein
MKVQSLFYATAMPDTLPCVLSLVSIRMSIVSFYHIIIHPNLLISFPSFPHDLLTGLSSNGVGIFLFGSTVPLSSTISCPPASFHALR